MLLLRDEAVWERAWSYKDHGKSYEAVYRREHGPGFRWVHEGVGSNWRMMELQAAIGLCQFRKLPDWLRARRGNAEHLLSRFEAITALRAPRPEPGMSHAYYRVYVYVRPEALAPKWTRDRIMTAIAAEGVAGLPSYLSVSPLEGRLLSSHCIYKLLIKSANDVRKANPMPRK